MRKLEIEKTKPTFIIKTLKMSTGGVYFIGIPTFFINKTFSGK